jgi:hypothetical protein
VMWCDVAIQVYIGKKDSHSTAFRGGAGHRASEAS